MRAGCYQLDLYCDNKAGAHSPHSFPHTYTAETGAECMREARAAGWKLTRIDAAGYRSGLDLCPKCSGKRAPTSAPDNQSTANGRDE